MQNHSFGKGIIKIPCITTIQLHIYHTKVNKLERMQQLYHKVWFLGAPCYYPTIYCKALHISAPVGSGIAYLVYILYYAHVCLLIKVCTYLFIV